ncbi:protoporphyrinogen oxidase HemJ [Pelagibacterium lentulum]|uniref:Protoporphyrinogen IX oxidase n=1 Tax=Pelagibacterium lentulum TaxID=2029865 RepID=A0A916R6X9_9HYPH|nr:protoporphyrinogen oxidase HemJ [Pelagibacterium lentulum]GGA37382.1 membrane protein [Pelagibacterium lentulum]
MNWYAWTLALHVIAVIAWMAGSLYLPRLFVYHADAKPGSEMSETFKIMERRLLKAIMTPAMVASWILGLTLAFYFGAVDFSQGWMWLKAAFVLALSGYHGLLVKHQKAFAADRNEKSARYFRAINEVPTVFMIIIVIAVIVKPF